MSEGGIVIRPGVPEDAALRETNETYAEYLTKIVDAAVVWADQVDGTHDEEIAEDVLLCRVNDYKRFCAAIAAAGRVVVVRDDVAAVLDAVPSEANWAGEVISDEVRGRLRDAIGGAG